MKSNSSKNKGNKIVDGAKNTIRPVLKSKTKKRKKTIKPSRYMMMFFWVLIMLLAAAVLLKVLHFFNSHW